MVPNILKRLKQVAWTVAQFRCMGANWFQAAYEFLRLSTDGPYFDKWYNYLSETKNHSSTGTIDDFSSGHALRGIDHNRRAE